ncbi:poly-beta-1,6-N-acetyl-D-glucosamine N-deacetylase PgaB [Halothiobacillus sp. DCM-1]|uniref:poly-beta-1,6-N-acetyl-D-glucosamine N-deacetylase PgaB n=1 Tax=Halothiobacillus sp. DCM-1 TaxID=3112558 RepID=UPI00324585C5
MDRRSFLRSMLGSLCVSVVAPGEAGAAAVLDRQPLITLQIPRGQFAVLCMHDVRTPAELGAHPDPYAISTDHLAQLFDWIKANDWHPVSLQQILDAHTGTRPLPDNAVLLSWDDGLASAYTHVYPLLLAYRYPALFAIETGWITAVTEGKKINYEAEVAGAANLTEGEKIDQAQAAAASNIKEPFKVNYEGKQEFSAKNFVTWAQLREMYASGLVEYASHTHDQHHGILANPQGNVEPACITRQYLKPLKRYETDAEYHRRLFDDLTYSRALIAKHTGCTPRSIVWPYGAANQEAIEIAASVGLGISFGLGDATLNNTMESTKRYGRLLLSDDPQPVDVEAQVSASITPRPEPERAVQVDLDYIFDPDPKQTDINLGHLLDRILALKIRTVYLQAFADPQGTGTPSAVYFPNTVLPMRADLFNRVAWQLQTRAGVQVLAWMPMLAFHLPDAKQQAALSVKIKDAQGERVPAQRDYARLSPFLPESLALIGQLYADLGKNNTGIFGVLFHDDAYLAEDEDASVTMPEARWPGTDRPLSGQPLSPREKTQALIDFGKALTQRLRYYSNVSNPFYTARNLYARVVLDPAAEARFAQALDPFIAAYDRVALMAMPYLDGTSEAPETWLRQLIAAVAQHPDGLKKVVFELQTKNWATNQWIDGHTLKAWMQLLIRHGGVNLAYYPDDFLGNHPPLRTTYEGMSLNDFPAFAPKTP